MNDFSFSMRRSYGLSPLIYWRVDVILPAGASCYQDDDNDDTHRQECTGCTEHCMILATCLSYHLNVILCRNKEDAKKTSGSPGKPLLLTYSLSYDRNLPDSNSQKEAIIKANDLPLLEEVTVKVNPLTSSVLVYLPHHQVQDFKAIAHLLNSYLYSSVCLFLWRAFPPTHLHL